MAAQSQGIKQLMAAEKEAAQVVANARKSKLPRGLRGAFLKQSNCGDLVWGSWVGVGCS